MPLALFDRQRNPVTSDPASHTDSPSHYTQLPEHQLHAVVQKITAAALQAVHILPFDLLRATTKWGVPATQGRKARSAIWSWIPKKWSIPAPLHSRFSKEPGEIQTTQGLTQ